MLSFLFAAASFSAPVPVYQDTWINSVLDFPRRGVAENTLHLMAVEITVNPNGYVERCRASAVLGNPQLGPYTCRLIQLRALFQAARDVTGHRSYGIYRQRVVWWRSNANPPKEIPNWDFTTPLGSVPANLKVPAVGRIKFVVDALGNVSTCAAEDSISYPGGFACSQLRQKFRVEAARTRSGKAVPSIQDVSVRYVGADGAKQ